MSVTDSVMFIIAIPPDEEHQKLYRNAEQQHFVLQSILSDRKVYLIRHVVVPGIMPDYKEPI